MKPMLFACLAGCYAMNGMVEITRKGREDGSSCEAGGYSMVCMLDPAPLEDLGNDRALVENSF
jgi:hypothetical protein